MPCPDKAALETPQRLRGSFSRCLEGYMLYQAMQMQENLPPTDCIM